MVTWLPTRVRLGEAEARTQLDSYLFGGRYGPQRVPRGIDPALVVTFLLERLLPEASPQAFRRALEVALFYESAAALPAFLKPLTLEIVSAADVERAGIGVKAAGALGTSRVASSVPEEAARAMDARLVPHPETRTVPLFELLLEARLMLAPVGSDQPLLDRLHAETLRAKVDEQKSEEAMVAYDQLAAVERNRVPRLQREEAEKLRLSSLPAAQRPRDLVRQYLGLADFGGYLEVWAARVLRHEALAGADLQPVFADLERQAAACDPTPKGAFYLIRAGQAIVYLGGEVSAGLKARWEAEAQFAGASFLWDDP